ncbi:hypothetical protein NSK11_contig00063-0001 [Nocardia seriolae]|uniref:Uncharacterized protein n=1 Tax=Nocardia seriolae TaxID=37332 RepID=A0ABC9YWC8_9NOCA|nr:hypothetical protein NSERKGN1266_13110 [Nocardia seriolae]BEK98804.1 hypothetical protein NSER024013_67100 [Nocardia seriolae]GAM47912.1 hypothetical protein NS07_v2contig00060-0046 [Nocardia seriolae]GAP29730.1 hypothetical protein NSK11_contig00063-0001 [Nocardia seriolae]GEM28370.1 hypothetical protein NS2_66090 [Nocardia seriolae NBRC 15557]
MSPTAYSVLVIGEVSGNELAYAISSAGEISPHDVDVYDDNGDQASRNWEAPAYCGYSRILGDAQLALFVEFSNTIKNHPSDEVFSRIVARSIGGQVVYPSASADPEEAWLVEPDGTRAQVRVVETEEQDGRVRYGILR